MDIYLFNINLRNIISYHLKVHMSLTHHPAIVKIPKEYVIPIIFSYHSQNAKTSQHQNMQQTYDYQTP